MKLTIITLAAICGICTTYAQKGSMLLYGNLAGSADKNIDLDIQSTIRSGLVNAGVGYQFSKHMTVGLQGGYTVSNTTSVNTATHTTAKSYQKEYGIGAFSRYTAYIDQRFFAYLQATAGYNRYWNNVSTQPRTTAEMVPGVGMFLYKQWAFTVTPGGIVYRHFSRPQGDVNSVNFDLGRSFQFGISKNFVKKEKAPKPHNQ